MRLPTIVDTGAVATDVWSEVEGALERTIQFDDFVAALAFVNRVGELAEAENHHPDIAIHYWFLASPQPGDASLVDAHGRGNHGSRPRPR